MMIARLIKKGSFKRQSITEPTDEQAGEQAEPLQPQPKAQSAPSSSGRMTRIRFNLSMNKMSGSTDCHKRASRPSFTLPDSWWAAYYLRRGTEQEAPRIISRSDKHDYRNPDSNYHDGIVEALRRTLQEESEELDLQHRLNPFLSKDFLKSLQRFGLFPEPEDEEEDAEEDLEDDDVGEGRRRTRSDASIIRSRTASMAASGSEEDAKKSERRTSLANPAEAMTAPTNVSLLLRKKLFQRRIRRWTLTSVSLRSLHQIVKRIPVPLIQMLLN